MAARCDDIDEASYVSTLVNGILSKQIVANCRKMQKTLFVPNEKNCRCASKENDFFPFFEENSKLQFREDARKVFFPYRIVSVTGPAGSGKTFNIVNFVANVLGDVGVSGTTNTATKIMNDAYQKIDLGKDVGTLFRLIQFKQPHTNFFFDVSKKSNLFIESQLINIAKYWPTLASIVQDLDKRDYDEVKSLINGDEARAKKIKHLHPQRVFDLALLKYIFIDECGQTPYYILDALAFIRCRMRYLLGLSTSDTPVFILIGSPTQTQALDVNENGQIVSCESMIDYIFHHSAVEKTLDVVKNSVRFLKIKRCSDETFNDCVYKLEHGVSLWKERHYLQQFVVEDETLLTDPLKQFQTDVVRLFLSHEDVRKYIQSEANGSSENFLEEDIYCVVSVNDMQRFLGLKTKNQLLIQQEIQNFITHNNLGCHSQFLDSLYSKEWTFLRQAVLLSETNEAELRTYEPPGKNKKYNFFDSSIDHNPTIGCKLHNDDDDSEKKNEIYEKREVILFKNCIRVKKLSPVITTRKVTAIVVGFHGLFQQLVKVIQGSISEVGQSPYLHVFFFNQLFISYFDHLDSSGCLKCADLFSDYDRSVIFSFPNPFQTDVRLLRRFLSVHSVNFKKRIQSACKGCVGLQNFSSYINLLESNPPAFNLHVLPKKWIPDNTRCEFIDFIPFLNQWMPRDRPFQSCEVTFPEISLKAALVKHRNLLQMIVPKSVFKPLESNHISYDVSVMYDIPIQNLTSMTVAKSTGASFDGVCCVFPPKIQKHLMRAVYVMISRVKGPQSNIFFNYNVFSNRKLYDTSPNKAQLISQRQMNDCSTLLLL